MPANINRTWEQNVASAVLTQLRGLFAYFVNFRSFYVILGLNFIKNKSEKFVREEWQKKLAPFLSLWKKLNQGYDFIRVPHPICETKGSSVIIFVSEEYSKAIMLIQKIHKCFAILNKISKGTVAAEEKDLQLANDLLSQQVS